MEYILTGPVEWKKEILFREGYTDGRDKAKVVVDPIIGRWIGWKVVMYNTNNNSAVKMESYIDNKDTNYWVQVTNLTDNGGWSAKARMKSSIVRIVINLRIIF